MGLALMVGMLGDALEHDPDARGYYREQFGAVSALLERSGLPPHLEPDSCESWDGEMFSYSGLHYLRRLAAHLELRGELPVPGDEQASKDPVLAAYYDIADGKARGLKRLLGRAKPRRQTFDHLILHSDAEGYYVPVDFESVLYGELEAIAGGMVGSSQRLLRECVRLRDALQVPEEIDPDGESLMEGVDSQGEGVGWQRYAVESFSCVRLIHAARLSIERRAAIVFC
jgi:hypothetical protein